MENGRTERIDILHIIRLFAASMIILYHTDLVGSCGFFGVQLFFIISGFLAYHSTCRKIPAGCYLLKRCIRLLPLYWIFTALTFAVLAACPDISNMSDGDPLHFLFSLLFIPFVGKTGAVLPILAVGWTMQYEMAFTLLFTLALLVSHRRRALVCSVLLLGLTAVGLFLKPAPLFLKYYTDSHLFDFFLGLLAGVIWHSLRGAAPSGRPVLSVLSGPAKILVYALLSVLTFGSLLYLILDPPLPFRLDYAFRFGVPAFVFVLSLALLADRIVLPSKVLALCSMTYSVYLVEYFTTSVYKRLIPEQTDIFRTGASLVLLYAVTFVLSVLPYLLIEVRLTSRLRRMLLPADEKGGGRS